MRFYSVFDLLVHTANQRNMKIDDMIAYFRQRGILKTQLDQMKQTAYYPANVVEILLSFLNMTELELNMTLGRIPIEYEDIYFENITKIATLLEKGIKPDNESIRVKPIFNTDLGMLYNNNCMDILKNIDTETVDLVFADPPFNLNKDYDDGFCDDLSMTSYLSWTFKWVEECVRILKPGGYLFIYNIPKWCTYIASYLNQRLTYWDWIAIDMKYRLPINGRLYPAHYSLISYVKGTSPATFNNQRIPLQTCRHCGGDIKDYGGYKSKMNPLGVNVSDVWSDIYPVRHKNTKNRKFNELPIKLLDRVISLSTNEGDIVFDPFGGSGTTYAVAELLNRRWIGCEIGNCDIIKERLQSLSNDERQMKKIKEDKEKLFTKEATKLRKKNGFWLTEANKPAICSGGLEENDPRRRHRIQGIATCEITTME